jgi:hypothetical protein
MGKTKETIPITLEIDGTKRSLNGYNISQKNIKLNNYMEELLQIIEKIIIGDTILDIQQELSAFRKLDPNGKLDALTNKSLEAFVANKTTQLIVKDLQNNIYEITKRFEYDESNQIANPTIEIELAQEAEVNMNLLYSLYIAYFGQPEPDGTPGTINGYNTENLKILIDAFETTGDPELLKLAGFVNTIIDNDDNNES